VFFVLTSALSALAGDWPQFLGPQRNGLSEETGLFEEWPADGPKEAWRVPGGVGMSGIAISDGRAFTLVQNENQQSLLALDPSKGTTLWNTPLAPAYENSMGNGPRATPAVSGEHVVAFTGEGILVCADVKSGQIHWQHHTVKELNGEEADYGMACSPLVVGKQVIVTVGAPGACVVAYDLESGKQLWTAGNDPAGYSSPALLEVAGSKQLVAYTGASALGLDPESGTVLWRFPYVTDYDCNIATPLAHKGNVFISSGENHGSALLKLTPSGDRFDVAEVWGSHGPKSILRNEWQTSMLIDGHLYGFDNVGSAGAVSHFTCVKADTGEQVWQQPRFGKGNLIAADGKLWITTMKGELVVLRATTRGYEELGRKTVIGETRQMPSLANGRLYLRDGSDILCLDVRK
jgi:outer membrane protein assembly factor BamB